MLASNNCSCYLGKQLISKIYRGNTLISNYLSNYLPWNNDIWDGTTWNIGVQNVNSFGINFYGTRPIATVNWGDGTTTNYAPGSFVGPTTYLTKNYDNTRNFLIKISECAWDSTDGRIRFGATTLQRQRVIYTSPVPSFPTLLRFNETFRDCSSLLNLPSGLFNNYPNANDFAFCFSGCTSLTTVPSTLFASNTAIDTLSFCFSNCTSLTTVPSTLFANNKAATNLSRCFDSCTSLTTIPSGLFNNNTAVTNFIGTFRNCTSLSSLPQGLFSNNVSATYFGNNHVTSFGSFEGCTSLTTIPSSLFANNVNVISFHDCFKNVTLTTTSYSNLLINMASNATSRLNNVSFGGGNSKYNTAGQTARNTLIAKGWTFTDGGLQT